MVKALVNQIPEQIRNRPLSVTVGTMIFFGGLLTAAGWQGNEIMREQREQFEKLDKRIARLEALLQYRWTVQMMKRFAYELKANNDMLFSPDVDRIKTEYDEQIGEQGH